MSCYMFIAAEKDNHSVSLLCRVLDVSRSGFYRWSTRPPSQRLVRDSVQDTLRPPRSVRYRGSGLRIGHRYLSVPVLLIVEAEHVEFLVRPRWLRFLLPPVRVPWSQIERFSLVRRLLPIPGLGCGVRFTRIGEVGKTIFCCSRHTAFAVVQESGSVEDVVES